MNAVQKNDYVGILASIVCFIHCTAPIFIAGLISTGLSFEIHPIFEVLFWAIAIYIAVKNFKHSPKISKWLFLIAGLFFIGSFFTTHSMAIISSLFLIAAHTHTVIKSHNFSTKKDLK